MKNIAVALTACLFCLSAFGQEFVYIESMTCREKPFGLILPPDVRKVLSVGKLLREKVFEEEFRKDGNYTATRKTLAQKATRI